MYQIIGCDHVKRSGYSAEEVWKRSGDSAEEVWRLC
jgi:hypothetical protein